MVNTIFDPTARAALLARIDRLNAKAPARWGNFTAPRMVSHLIAAIRIALGDEPAKFRPGPLSSKLLRSLVIYVIPWPKGVKTAPEMLARAPESWTSDISALKAVIERAAATSSPDAWHTHPAFGALSAREWGALIHRHVSHHLTQFGV